MTTIRTDCCGNADDFLVADQFGDGRVRVEGTCPVCGADGPVGTDIARVALPVVLAVPAAQDTCWPGDGPAHDDHCALADHAASRAAVSATEGLSWEFTSWSAAAEWLRRGVR